MFSGKTRIPRGLNIAVIAIAVPAIFCTIALPAYAAQNTNGEAGADATAQLQHLKTVDAQSADLSTGAQAASDASGITRDSFTATSQAELDAAKAAAAAEAERASLRAAYSSYSGPSARAYLANPPYPNFSLSQVVAVAEQYQGVPYRYGGADPSGFDCSGFTMFVYAQFGVALPHSAARQGSGGISISPADAQPGDLVAMDGGDHIGIYLGGNMMIDAPEPGRVVQIRAIYTASHWFVRYGA